MTISATPHLQTNIIYPETDGTPMGETDKHRDAMVALIETLKDHYRNQPTTYVSGNLFIYYEEGDPSAVFAPDAFVTFNVPKQQRRTYRVWEEGGKSPDVIFEVSSKNTWLDDEGRKKVISRLLNVQEYYLFDPDKIYMDAPLKGYELADGEYHAMPFDDEDRLYSTALNLYLTVDGNRLRLINAETGDPLLHPDEAQEAHRQAMSRAIFAEITAREEAEARQKAEAELARLQAELAQLKKQS